MDTFAIDSAGFANWNDVSVRFYLLVEFVDYFGGFVGAVFFGENFEF